MSLNGRALHWVFKIGDRKATMDFYRNVLGMKILRHEEFSEGCQATCNGPYDGKWSKTMVGFGPEDNNFVVELTYNYEVNKYDIGNDFQGITVNSGKAWEKAKALESQEVSPGCFLMNAPDGYPFFINKEGPKDDQVTCVAISVSDLNASLKFWKDLLGMEETGKGTSESESFLGFPQSEFTLHLKKSASAINRGSAFGRIAFAVASEKLPGIEVKVKEAGHTILTPFTRLDTPGKATVEVVILADPDGQEICFVGEEAFSELSQVDPNAEALLDKALEEDKSNEWYAKKGKEKKQA